MCDDDMMRIACLYLFQIICDVDAKMKSPCKVARINFTIFTALEVILQAVGGKMCSTGSTTNQLASGKVCCQLSKGVQLDKPACFWVGDGFDPLHFSPKQFSKLACFLNVDPAFVSHSLYDFSTTAIKPPMFDDLCPMARQAWKRHCGAGAIFRERAWEESSGKLSKNIQHGYMTIK